MGSRLEVRLTVGERAELASWMCDRSNEYQNPLSAENPSPAAQAQATAASWDHELAADQSFPLTRKLVRQWLADLERLAQIPCIFTEEEQVRLMAFIGRMRARGEV